MSKLPYNGIEDAVIAIITPSPKSGLSETAETQRGHNLRTFSDLYSERESRNSDINSTRDCSFSENCSKIIDWGIFSEELIWRKETVMVDDFIGVFKSLDLYISDDLHKITIECGEILLRFAHPWFL